MDAYGYSFLDLAFELEVLFFGMGVAEELQILTDCGGGVLSVGSFDCNFRGDERPCDWGGWDKLSELGRRCEFTVCTGWTCSSDEQGDDFAVLVISGGDPLLKSILNK